MGQVCMYGAQIQLDKLEKMGDPLIEINKIINWEMFREPLERRTPILWIPWSRRIGKGWFLRWLRQASCVRVPVGMFCVILSVKHANCTET